MYSLFIHSFHHSFIHYSFILLSLHLVHHALFIHSIIFSFIHLFLSWSNRFIHLFLHSCSRITGNHYWTYWTYNNLNEPLTKKVWDIIDDLISVLHTLNNDFKASCAADLFSLSSATKNIITVDPIYWKVLDDSWLDKFILSGALK